MVAKEGQKGHCTLQVDSGADAWAADLMHGLPTGQRVAALCPSLPVYCLFIRCGLHSQPEGQTHRTACRWEKEGREKRRWRPCARLEATGNRRFERPTKGKRAWNGAVLSAVPHACAETQEG